LSDIEYDFDILGINHNKISGISVLELVQTIYQTRCGSYDPEALFPIIKEHIDRHLSTIDLSGKRILLKVNLLSGRSPEQAVTTHPMFVEAVANVLIGKGASCTIGDSPGGPFTVPALEKAYRITGYRDVAKRTGSALNFDVSYSDHPVPEGRFVKRFWIGNYIRGHDLVIALPKIKTHMLMGLTCASKIMFGAVPGLEKISLHGRFQTPGPFARMLLDLTASLSPDLFLVDGIVGMDGEGPAKGRPREIGVVMSGKDHIEIDLHVCDICGLDVDTIPYFEAYKEMYGRDLPDVVIEGPSKCLHIDPPFEPARGWSVTRDPPRILRNMARSLLSGRPEILKDKCTGCMFCAENCAGDAIIEKGGKARIDRSRCIRCYCCHELCPHGAVTLKDAPLLPNRVLSRIIMHSSNTEK
jgi:uncharacterized protein (DUF362 family)/Pyruvate/2-oxoacid:ferredoxin oxidoreductase delta subunit